VYLLSSNRKTKGGKNALKEFNVESKNNDETRGKLFGSSILKKKVFLGILSNFASKNRSSGKFLK
jgi:hypothetical protein